MVDKVDKVYEVYGACHVWAWRREIKTTCSFDMKLVVQVVF